MIIDYIRNQNNATIKFAGFLMGFFSKLLGISFVAIIAFFAKVPSDFYVFIGIHFLVTLVMFIKEGSTIEELKEKNIDLSFLLLSSINFALYMYCIYLINKTLQVGDVFNYLFIIITLVSVLRMYYMPSLLRDIAVIFKKYNKNVKDVRSGKINISDFKRTEFENLEAETKRLSRKVFPLLTLPSLFMLVALYWFYIKALILIQPGFLIIALLVLLSICENVFDLYARKVRKILIEKTLDDGNK